MEKNLNSITINNRRSIHDNLKKYDYLAKEGDFIEVTEWLNEDGVDVSFSDKNISLTFGELSAINYLCKTLEYNG